MLGEAMLGMNALKTAFDISRGLKDINDATIRNSAVIDLQDKILSAQQAHFELMKRIDELEKQLAAAANTKERLDRYALKDYGGNTFAYELREEAANGEPIHRACPTCFQSQRVSILQFDFTTNRSQDRFECPTCKTFFEFGTRSPPPPRRPVRGFV